MIDFVKLQKNKQLYKEEMVLCIPSFEEDIDKDFIEFKGKDPNHLSDTYGKYIKRYKVEGDIGMYQLIPYLVVINRKGEILTHISKKNNKVALGFSIHITPEIGGHNKATFKACTHLAMYAIGKSIENSPIVLDGYIKTHTETTKGHLGMLYFLHADKINIKEDENFIYKFKTKEDLFENYYDKMEDWAKITLGRLY